MEEIKSDVIINAPVNKKNKFYYLLFFIIVIIFILYFYFNSPKIPEPVYQFSRDKFYYSQERGNVSYEMIFRSDNKTFEMYNISFYSRDLLQYKTKIYGILLMPKDKINVPGVVLLPGGGGRKENELGLASLIANEGYAVLTIDQRGIGETGGYYLNYDDDYKIFIKGSEPVQHLSVYDVLASYDVLRSMKNVDKNNILVAGESMGGRYAIIAAAQDRRLKGVLGISTGGFHIKGDSSTESNFFLSIDPDHYISDISPNYVIMLHGGNDSTILLKDAQISFNFAKEPKKFYVYSKCGHGYCKDMDDEIKKSLKLIFGIK